MVNPAQASGGTARRAGVLALQGDFERHQACLEALGVAAVRVTRSDDLDGLDALILPGGESTTMVRLMDANGLREPLVAFCRTRPVLGTCAGVILLGRGGERLPAPPLELLDVEVSRNAYGRQIDSFTEPLDVPVLDAPFHGVFIRAPKIVRSGDGVDVIARRGEASGGEVVGVRQGTIVGLTFHPELTGDTRLHHWFLSEVAGLTLPAASAWRGAPTEAA